MPNRFLLALCNIHSIHSTYTRPFRPPFPAPTSKKKENDDDAERKTHNLISCPGLVGEGYEKRFVSEQEFIIKTVQDGRKGQKPPNAKSESNHFNPSQPNKKKKRCTPNTSDEAILLGGDGSGGNFADTLRSIIIVAFGRTFAEISTVLPV